MPPSRRSPMEDEPDSDSRVRKRRNLSNDMSNEDDGRMEAEEGAAEPREYAEQSDGDAEQGEERHRRTKKHKKKKVAIMAASGQSDSDRRALRRKQRELHQLIVSGEGGEELEMGLADAIADPASGELQRVRKKNNALWNDVRYAREAVLDSENVGLIAVKASKQVEKLIEVPRYDAVRLAHRLAAKCSSDSSNSHFSWHNFGIQAGVCFNAVPSHVFFLYGPLDASYRPKERKKPERRAKRFQSENGEEERPDDVDQGKAKETSENALSAVEKHMEVITATLKQRSAEGRQSAASRKNDFLRRVSGGIGDEKELQKKEGAFHRESKRVDAVNFLFNPASFTQTVENIFHFSFLVRNYEAGVSVRSVEDAEEYGGAGPGPVVELVDRNNGTIPPPKQAIVSLTMKDWKDMCAAFEVEESDVPNRKSPKKRLR